MKLVRTIFLYLVLFVTLMMSIGGSVSVFMSVADLVSPPDYYQSFEIYKENYNLERNKSGQQPTLSETELRRNYDNMVLEEKQRTKERAINQLIKSFGWIIIPLPIFLYFKRYLRSQE